MVGEPRVELVLGYTRVSVVGEDLRNQEAEIREYCSRRGYHLLKIFHDMVTGTLDPLARPGFKRMLELAEELGVRRIVVYDISRLGRRLGEVVAALRELQRRQLIVEFVKHPELDTSNPVVYNTLLFAFSLAAELERQAMKERMEAARRAGKRIGRRPVEIPWHKVEELLRRGWKIKEIYKYLIGEGYLRYKEKGVEKVLSYEQFRRRVKAYLETKGLKR